VPDPETGEIPAAAHGPARRALGGILAGVAALGLLHLAQGAPSIDAAGDDLEAAAGIVGALIGEPLQALVATGGALAVLMLVLVAGVVLLLDLTLRTASRRALAGVRPAAAGGARAFGSLFRLDRERGAAMSSTSPMPGPAPAPLPTAPASTTSRPMGGSPRRGASARPSSPPSRSRTPSSWPSISGRVPSRRPGSCRRPSCSTGPGRRASIARRSRRSATTSSGRWPSTTSRPVSSG
jgi:hypothetical protein